MAQHSVNDSYHQHLKDHTQAILKDVSLVPKFGTPGFVMAYGEGVYPQVISSESNILICAAECQSGRIVVATHGNYANGLKDGSEPDLQTLQANILNWLSNGFLSDINQNEKHLLEITGDASVANIDADTKVLFWAHNEENLSVESEEIIARFVRSGGGLFYAFTPWAYVLYVKPTVPLQGFLAEIGMTFSDDYDVLYGSDGGFSIQLNADHYNGALTNNLSEFSKQNQEFLESNSLLRHQKYLRTMVSHRDQFRAQMLQLYQDNTNVLQIPTKDNPVKTNTGKSMLVLSDLLSRYGIAGMEISPGAGHFPGLAVDPANKGYSVVSSESGGDFRNSAKMVELEMNSYTKDVFSTGCYINPGQKVKVEILSGSGEGWRVRVGAHTDFLNPDRQGELRRFFDVCVTKHLNEPISELVSPYGGILQFESPEKDGIEEIRLRLSNVLLMPYFDLKDDLSRIRWSKAKQYPGAWADIAGEYFTVTLPRLSIQGLDDPSKVMAKWDRIIRLMHFLRGTDVRLHRRQWLVTDEQPSTGYMHMGYPIVSHLDIADPGHQSFVLSGNWPNFWGIYHEIGHNLQRDAWTFDGTVEVTCNIFSMFCMSHVAGSSPLGCEWVQLQMPGIKHALKVDNYSFEKWKADPGVAIGIYAQLCEHLGWGCMCDVLRHYEAMTTNKPESDQDKIDVWFVTYSNSARVNLAPLFDFWQWPVSESKKQEVMQYPKWLPEDEITEMVPERVNDVAKKHPNMERSVSQREFPYVFESKSTITKIE